ncbi:MAG: hypothetical protein RJA22_277 [Verrucomicrobiota bacterium]
MNLSRIRVGLGILLGLLAGVASPASAQTFTLQVGAAPLPPAALVARNDVFRYRPARTNAPQADWRSAANTSLDGTWLSGPGGFGYGDPGIAGENTTLANMVNNYSSLAIRREFTIAGPIDPARRLQLTVDYDDGYIAWLDGVEVSRSPNTAGLGTPPAWNASTVSANHEASCCNAPVNAPSVIDLGPVGSRLGVGSHVLALQGVNGGSNSSDFHLIADLAVVGGQGQAVDGAFFSLVKTNVTLLSGTNTLPGAARVTVNGAEADFNPLTGLWSRSQPLEPGFNRLFIAAHDAYGRILYATNRDVVAELDTREVGGVFTAGGVWAQPGTTIRVTNDLIVTGGGSVVATGAVVVLLSPNVSIRVETNGTFTSWGLPGRRAVFLPADGTTPWGGLRAIGTNDLLNPMLSLARVEVVAGQVRAQNGGTVLVEDSVLRDLNVGTRVLVEGLNGGSLTVRRSHLARYVECDSSDTPTLYEDCLLEEISTDGTDLKAANSPIVVRRCTFRFGAGSNTDAVDFGPGPNSLVESCLIHDMGDKGVSIAAGSQGTVVRNCLIYGNTLGISIDRTTNITAVGNTISGCQVAWNLEAGTTTPVSGFGTNNIFWGNLTNAVIPTNGSLLLEYSLTDTAPFPGPGNLSADPLFTNPAAADYRLSPGSPALGAGLGGTHLGVTFPVGGLPGAPRHLAALVNGFAPLQLAWLDHADNETGFELERSSDGLAWSPLASLGPNTTNHTDASAALDQTYVYRVRALNGSGASDWSNPAAGRRGAVLNVVCGTLTTNTTWSPAAGEYLVCSNLFVPAGVTLRLEPGTVVRLTNGASLRAVSGGRIEAAGTEDNKVVLAGVDGTNTWGEISAQFAGSSLLLRHTDVSRRQTTVYSNAVGLLEDSFFHDYRLVSGGTTFNQPIILSHFAQLMTARRIHVREYHETLWRNGVIVIEGSLFEHVHGDAVDFDSAQPGSVIRDCTFRHGTNGNVDAIDIGPADLPGSLDVRVENCLMFDFPFDKGVSVGDTGDSSGSIVSNCLIYACRSGVMAKDLCDVSVRQTTIILVTNDSLRHAWGFTNYNKANPTSPTGGGITTNSYNNIIWGTGTTISMVNGSQLYCDHNLLYNTNWPGTGNFTAEPLFVNPAQRDYRLQPGSPALTAGRAGAPLGAQFPVGSPLALSHPRIDQLEAQGNTHVVRFWADNERTYSLLASDQVAGGTWSKVADIGLGTVPRRLAITNAVPAATSRFYRLVSPQQP